MPIKVKTSRGTPIVSRFFLEALSDTNSYAETLDKLFRTNAVNDVASTRKMLEMAHYLGQQLQGIPKQHREFAISRLANVRDDLIRDGLAPEIALLFDGIIIGWTHWHNAEASLEPPPLTSDDLRDMGRR